MTRTDPVGTRDKERTRRAILETAERLFTERGAEISIATIAAEAGVTKGGLMHHFPSREALKFGVFEHVIVRMWEEVKAHIDLSENRPGKFTRGYVRAFTGDSVYLAQVFNPIALITVLGQNEQVDELYKRDAEKWDAAFAADGLPHSRVLLIRYAADGLSMATAGSYLTPADLAVARAELLAMSEIP